MISTLSNRTTSILIILLFNFHILITTGSRSDAYYAS
jgi:hypothetical protein